MYQYKIGDKNYVQKPLVLGQIRQLSEHLNGMTLPKSKNVFEIVSSLGERLPGSIAIVLTEEGKSPADKDLEKIGDEINWKIDHGTLIKVIEDFFDCTPIFSIMEKLGDVMKKTGIEIRLMKSSVSSQKEILPSEMPSFGDSLLKSASDSQKNAQET